MDWDVFAKNFTSWLIHLFPLLISGVLFISVYIFSEKIYLFLFLVLVTFLVSAVLDMQLKKGVIIGGVTAVVLSIVNFLFWNNYVKMQKLVSTLNSESDSLGSLTSISSMFGKPLHPLIFIPLIIVVVFGPLFVVWLVRKNSKGTNQVSKL